METGKLVTQDVVLDDSYNPGNVYVVAMLEQDQNRDILTGNSWSKVLEFWANHWMKSFPGREMTALMALAFGGGLDTDEYLGATELPHILPSQGLGKLVVFAGDGGRYRARFVIR